MSNSPFFPYQILNEFLLQIFPSHRVSCMLNSQTNWLRANKSFIKGLILQRSWVLLGCARGTGHYDSQNPRAYVQYPARSSKYFKISHEKCNLLSVAGWWYELLNCFWSVDQIFCNVLYLVENVSRTEFNSMTRSTSPEPALLEWLTCVDSGNENRWEVPGGKRLQWAAWETAALVWQWPGHCWHLVASCQRRVIAMLLWGSVWVH